MSRFKVVVHGYGIQVTNSAGALMTGFYTTRKVNAADSEVAAKIALDMVAKDWKDDRYADLNQGGQPTLEIDVIIRLGYFSEFFNRRQSRGYTFYGDSSPPSGQMDIGRRHGK